MPNCSSAAALTCSRLSSGRFRYQAEATIRSHQHLVLRAPDGEVVLRRRAAADLELVCASWVDERPDLVADIITIA